MKLEDIGFYTLSDERAANTSAVSRMQRCEMIINEYCNFNCPYCQGLDDRVFGGRITKQLTLEEMKQNIDWWCERGSLKNIRFSGGEPTLHPDIVCIVEYAKSKGIERIAISTNGSSERNLYDILVYAGVNDFSISLDSANATTGDTMAGSVNGAWDRVIANIKHLAAETYVTVGAVLNPENIGEFVDLVKFASSLGVADIRVISAAQWDKPLEELANIPQEILAKHPILAYRVKNFMDGKGIRGIREYDNTMCPLVLDDSVIAGEEHYPCVIYMRERGDPIGKVSSEMRWERMHWWVKHNTHMDEICRKNCLDVCIDYNNKVRDRCLAV